MSYSHVKKMYNDENVVILVRETWFQPLKSRIAVFDVLPLFKKRQTKRQLIDLYKVFFMTTQEAIRNLVLQ